MTTDKRMWIYWCQRWLGVDERLARRVWNAMLRTPEARILSFRWSQMCRSPDLGRVMDSMLDRPYGPWHPQKCMPIIEQMAASGVLSRQDATRFEEGILYRTNKKGDFVP